MPKVKLERRYWSKQQLSFMLDCIKRRHDIIESDPHDAFNRSAKLLAWKDVQDQMFKRFNAKWDVHSLKTKWGKMKYEARRRLSLATSKGEALVSKDWVSTVLGIIRVNTDDDQHYAKDPDNDENNLAVYGECSSVSSPKTNNEFVEELSRSVKAHSGMYSEHQQGSIVIPKLEMMVDDEELTFNNPTLSNVGNCQENPEVLDDGEERGMELNFRRQLYQGTLQRLQQEHKMKMELLKVKYEEEKVKLDILKIQREEAQRKNEAVKNDKRTSEQWFSQINNHNDEFNHFPTSE